MRHSNQVRASFHLLGNSPSAQSRMVASPILVVMSISFRSVPKHIQDRLLSTLLFLPSHSLAKVNSPVNASACHTRIVFHVPERLDLADPNEEIPSLAVLTRHWSWLEWERSLNISRPIQVLVQGRSRIRSCKEADSAASRPADF